MINENARGYESNPTDQSTDPRHGEDSDAATDQPSTSPNKGCAGQESCEEEFAADAQETVYESADLLPKSWDAVDAERPRKLRAEVTPRDVQLAAAEAETVLEVSRDLRCMRKPTKTALTRLGLGDENGNTPMDVGDGHTVLPDGGVDNSVDVKAQLDLDIDVSPAAETLREMATALDEAADELETKADEANKEVRTDGGTADYDPVDTRPSQRPETADVVDPDLSKFQIRILAVLAEEARYGLAIKGELEAYYGEDVNHGRLYPNLDELVQKGFVEKSELDKRTNEYAITDEGAQALGEEIHWLADHFGLDLSEEGGDD